MGKAVVSKSINLSPADKPLSKNQHKTDLIARDNEGSFDRFVQIWRWTILKKRHFPSDPSMIYRVLNQTPVSVIDGSKWSINKVRLDLDIFEIQPVKDQSLLDVRNPNHPLNFHFEIDIASPQRKQYESEMIRRKVSDG